MHFNLSFHGDGLYINQPKSLESTSEVYVNRSGIFTTGSGGKSVYRDMQMSELLTKGKELRDFSVLAVLFFQPNESLRIETIDESSRLNNFQIAGLTDFTVLDDAHQCSGDNRIYECSVEFLTFMFVCAYFDDFRCKCTFIQLLTHVLSSRTPGVDYKYLQRVESFSARQILAKPWIEFARRIVKRHSGYIASLQFSIVRSVLRLHLLPSHDTGAAEISVSDPSIETVLDRFISGDGIITR